MKRPALFTSEEKINPVLIVDKIGILGNAIAKELSQELLVVLVSAQNPHELNDRNVIYVPYRKKFPVIPDNVYSHIILFDEEDSSIENSIPTFIKKADKDDSVVIYLSKISVSSQNFSKKITESYKKLKIILYGDIFGTEAAFWFQNPVNFVLSQIPKEGKISIPGDGLAQVYPVLFSDVVKEILSVVFGASKERTFFIFSKHPMSLMSLAHIFQKKDPTITIDFTKEKKEVIDRKITISGEYMLDESYDIEGKLKELDLSVANKPQERDLTQDNFPKKIKLNFIPYFLFFVFLLILPVISTALFAGLGVFQLNYAKNNIEKGNLALLNTPFRNAQTLFNLASSTGKALEYESSAVGLLDSVTAVTDKIEDAKKITQAAGQILQTSSIAQSVLNGKSKNPQEDVFSSLSSLKESISLINEVKLREKIDESILKKINDYDSIINYVYGFSNITYSLINPMGQRKYLVLFQNNMELRPGGGFIGSYGILVLDKGKLADFSIHDVYDADGQLKGHVEPPYAIRRYLPSAHLYLRDSNFDVDFTKSAASAANLLFQETGQKVDGVIGVDVTFVKDLIGAIGEIDVPEYKEKVNAQNFFHVTESHVEKNFFPSSTQKKDFLGALFTAIENNLSQRKNIPYQEILKVFISAIREKHVLFAFSDKSVQNVFSANGWSSELNDYRDSLQINDFLGISEANLGVNKANFFVGRSIKYEMNIKDNGTVESFATLNLRNDSNSWPGGDYKTYVRLIAPQGSSLTSITIDGATQNITNAITNFLIYEKKNFRPPTGLEVENYNENGKTIYGFLTIVPQGKTKKIVFNYTLPKKIPLRSPLSVYSLRIFKQPGTENYPFDFIVSYPSSVMVSSSKNINIVNGKIMLSKTLSFDENIELNISRK